MPFTIRDFQPADFETLWRIDQHCFPPGHFLFADRTQALHPPPRIVHSARHRRRLCQRWPLPIRERARKILRPSLAANAPVAGFIVAEADRVSGHIITIDVIAAARRSGVDRSCLRAAEDRLRAASCRSVELETAVDNISALSFYKRHGYSVIKTFPRYYSNGVDALVLEKDLLPASLLNRKTLSYRL